MNEMPASAQGDFSYSHSEVPRGGGVAAEDMVGNVDEYGLPRVSSSVTESSEPSLFSHEEPRFSTSRPLDAGFANDRVSIANMGRPSRAPAARPYSRPEPQGEMKEMDNFAPKEEGEIRPGSSVSRTTRNTFGGDIEQTADSAEQAAATEAAVAEDRDEQTDGETLTLGETLAREMSTRETTLSEAEKHGTIRFPHSGTSNRAVG